MNNLNKSVLHITLWKYELWITCIRLLAKSPFPHLHTRSFHLSLSHILHIKIENIRAVTLWDLVATFLWRSLLDKYPPLCDMRCNFIAIILGSNVIDWCTYYDKIPTNFVDKQIFLWRDAFHLVYVCLNTKI